MREKGVRTSAQVATQPNLREQETNPFISKLEDQSAQLGLHLDLNVNDGVRVVGNWVLPLKFIY